MHSDRYVWGKSSFCGGAGKRPWKKQDNLNSLIRISNIIAHLQFASLTQGPKKLKKLAFRRSFENV